MLRNNDDPCNISLRLEQTLFANGVAHCKKELSLVVQLGSTPRQTCFKDGHSSPIQVTLLIRSMNFDHV